MADIAVRSLGYDLSNWLLCGMGGYQLGGDISPLADIPQLLSGLKQFLPGVPTDFTIGLAAGLQCGLKISQRSLVFNEQVSVFDGDSDLVC